MWPIFTDRYSIGEFHVLVEGLKLYDREFFFKHIATRHFEFTQSCFTVFFLFNNLLHSAISLTDNTIEWFIPHWSWIFFNSKTEKNISSTRKRNHCVFSRFACGNLKIFIFSGKISKVEFGLYVRKEKIVNFCE